jgi:predicted lipase
VALVFRGSHTWQNWFSNLSVFLSQWPEGGKVHWGFKIAFEALWPQVADYLVTRQVPLFYTGHSLGAALAILAATKKEPQAVYTFGAPRVGDETFVHCFKHIPIYNIVNNQDIVASVPTESMGFHPIGILHHLNSHKPPRSYWFEPPRSFADHSPINYIVHLQKQLSASTHLEETSIAHHLEKKDAAS